MKMLNTIEMAHSEVVNVMLGELHLNEKHSQPHNYSFLYLVEGF